jgi:uncharacterized protein
MSKTKKVNCPNCSVEVEWIEANEYRPFCSERCKLIDFGDWAMERNNIPGEDIYPVDVQEQDQ